MIKQIKVSNHITQKVWLADLFMLNSSLTKRSHATVSYIGDTQKDYHQIFSEIY